MTAQDFINKFAQHNARFIAPSSNTNITKTDHLLQRYYRAKLPAFLIDLYKNTGGINLGSGYIFGPDPVKYSHNITVPSISEINSELSKIKNLQGQTIFGRNDLFWFSFDAFGNCYMLSNTSCKPLKKYSDPYQALNDCLMGGKF